MDCFLALKGFNNKNESLKSDAILRIMVFGALIYANTLTASLNIVGTSILFSYYFAQFINSILRWLRKTEPSSTRLGVFGIILMILAVSATFEVRKALHPYAWWDVAEPSVFSGNARSKLDILQGMQLSRRRVQLLDSFVAQIQELTSPSDPILVYPNIPVFYLLANRMPMTRSYIQWFDFARTETLLDDFKKVSATPPKVVVEMTVPREVYQGHEKLIGHQLVQQFFAEYLQCMVDHGGFKVLAAHPYSQTGPFLESIRYTPAPRSAWSKCLPLRHLFTRDRPT